MVIKDTESGVCQETHEYYCYFCTTWSDKDNWGPGRITCPNCKQRALTPAEIKYKKWEEEKLEELEKRKTDQEKWEKVLFADLQKMDFVND